MLHRCDQNGAATADQRKKKNVDPELEPIEADRQEEVSPWARAFGVSSDDLRGVTAREDDLQRDEQDPDRKGPK